MEIRQNIQCVGFIMDGNRRWAKERGLDSLEGHLRGYENMRTIITAVTNLRIPHAVFYAFSTENWNRSEIEVSYLMRLLEHALADLRTGLAGDNQEINLRVIGERERLPESLQRGITAVEAKNTNTPDITVWVALSYGGRAEIIDAVNKAVHDGQEVTEQHFETLLWSRGMPDPDLIIRTSGEYRLSNFLAWQSVYSELFFTDTYWPDFGESEFQSIVEEYGKRIRRHGT